MLITIILYVVIFLYKNISEYAWNNPLVKKIIIYILSSLALILFCYYILNNPI